MYFLQLPSVPVKLWEGAIGSRASMNALAPFPRYVHGVRFKVLGYRRIKRARSAREDSSIYIYIYMYIYIYVYTCLYRERYIGVYT